MKKIFPWLGGVLIVGGVLIYQQHRHLSVIVMIETTVLIVAVIVGILHLISLWRNRR